MVLHKFISSINACKTSLSNNFESNKTFTNHNYLLFLNYYCQREQNKIAFLYSSRSTCVKLIYKIIGIYTHVNSILWDVKQLIQNIETFHWIASKEKLNFMQQYKKIFYTSIYSTLLFLCYLITQCKHYKQRYKMKHHQSKFNGNRPVLSAEP